MGSNPIGPAISLFKRNIKKAFFTFYRDHPDGGFDETEGLSPESSETHKNKRRIDSGPVNAAV
jgi:hypothetical protein